MTQQKENNKANKKSKKQNKRCETHSTFRKHFPKTQQVGAASPKRRMIRNENEIKAKENTVANYVTKWIFYLILYVYLVLIHRLIPCYPLLVFLSVLNCIAHTG